MESVEKQGESDHCREETGHIRLRKKPSGHRPGVPGTPGATNRGLPAGNFLFYVHEKNDRKGHFCRASGWVVSQERVFRTFM